MGRSRPRYNEKARMSSHSSKNAKPHPNARDGGKAALVKKWKTEAGVKDRDLRKELLDEVLESQFEEFHGIKRKDSTLETDLDENEDGYNSNEYTSDMDNDEVLKTQEEIDEENKLRKLKLLNQLPEAPEGKVSSKKRKRLEKYVEKQLKKQDKERVLENLAKHRIDSDIFMSSRNLGRTKQTAKEKVKMAFLEEKQGIPRSDDSINLVLDRQENKLDEHKEDSTSEKASEVKNVDIPSPVVKIVVRKRADRKDQEENNSKDINQISMWKSDAIDGEKIQSAALSEAQLLAKEIIEMEDLERKKRIPKVINKVIVPGTPAIHIPVFRSPELQVSRMSLPVVMEELPIMEAIMANDVIILSGETGSGKTTQVPQFLYEAGFGFKDNPKFPGMIGITQPRRVAAISMAQRVADEMGLLDGQVSYQVRYDKGQTFDGTKIKFMTDGILLRELTAAAEASISSDDITDNNDSQKSHLLLLKYSCIIVDEAHERTIGTDTLIGWLTRVVRLRNSGRIKGVKPLKLIIMSATLRVDDFTENKTLFPKQNVPVVKVDGRCHKVVIHYNRITPEEDYLTEAYKKICKIHERLPHGGALVFVTGRQEVTSLVSKLRKQYPSKISYENFKLNKDEEGLEEKENKKRKISNKNCKDEMFKDILGLNEMEIAEMDETEVIADNNDELSDQHDDFDDVLEEENLFNDEEENVEILNNGAKDEDDFDVSQFKSSNMASTTRSDEPLWVLPLYSLLSHEEQLKVFQPPPAGHRLVVVATNVAEASITIPNIKYVVDTGKVKERSYNPFTNSQTFQINWTSKAGADQRAGRAGRTTMGHCYRLYSSAVFHDIFPKYAVPEILRVPLESVVLQMKAMGINQVIGFPFPTPPDSSSLRTSEQLLVYLGALTESSDSNKRLITPIGKLMTRFAISPRYSKIILSAAKLNNHLIIEYVILISAIASVGEIFMTDPDLIKDSKVKQKKTLEQEGDENEVDYKTRDEEAREKMLLKERRKKYHSVMAQFTPSSMVESDHLIALEALRCYINASTKKNFDAKEFCDSHFLRPKAISEVLKLRYQLINTCKLTLISSEAKKELNITGNVVDKLSLNTNSIIPEPNSETRTTIRRLILEGFVDNIAKLNEPETLKLAKIAQSIGSGVQPAVYETLDSNVNERFLLGNQSSVRNVSPHIKWIIYSEIAGKERKIAVDGKTVIDYRKKNNVRGQTETYYLKTITIIDPKWISDSLPKSLCRFGTVLDQPVPKWDEKLKYVVGYRVPTLGPKAWCLPAIKCQVEDKYLSIKERIELKKRNLI